VTKRVRRVLGLGKRIALFVVFIRGFIWGWMGGVWGLMEREFVRVQGMVIVLRVKD
jgi:hypothetical protein